MKKIIVSLVLILYGFNIFDAFADVEWYVQSKTDKYDKSGKFETYFKCEQFRMMYSHPDDYICVQG